MRSTSYPGVCTKPGTYYQGWFMYMRYTQGQNEEYFLSRRVYLTRYLLSKFHCIGTTCLQRPQSLGPLSVLYEQVSLCVAVYIHANTYFIKNYKMLIIDLLFARIVFINFEVAVFFHLIP